MSVSLNIIPLTRSVDMYGIPDKSSAYSLSGHVALSLRSPYSFFERRSTARLLLQSLELTFEGQTEVITPKIGYSAIRLCSFSQELVTSGPLELSNEGEEESTEPCVWNVVFNLPIPGWLPESTCGLHSELGVRYALHATAKFVLADDHQSLCPWFFAALCTPFRSRVRYAYMQQQIEIRRFVEPPSDTPFIPSISTYVIKAPTPQLDKAGIRPEILQQVQVIVNVPESLDMQADVIPITLRMRTRGLDAAECKRLQVKEITANILQKEKYRSRPFPSYLSTYPVPPKERQPPNEPLLSPHPVGNIYEYGFAIPSQDKGESTTRITSFLPPGESGLHRFTNENYVFADDSNSPDWYTIEIALPFVTEKTTDDGQGWWSEISELQPATRTPLFHITHEIALSVTLSYDLNDSKGRVYDRLSIKAPIDVVRVLPSVGARSAPLSPYTHAPTPATPASPVNACALPAYSQLYDEEGERKIDYAVPLPLYEPPAASPVSKASDTNVKAVVKATSSQVTP